MQQPSSPTRDACAFAMAPPDDDAVSLASRLSSSHRIASAAAAALEARSTAESAAASGISREFVQAAIREAVLTESGIATAITRQLLSNAIEAATGTSDVGWELTAERAEVELAASIERCGCGVHSCGCGWK